MKSKGETASKLTLSKPFNPSPLKSCRNKQREYQRRFGGKKEWTKNTKSAKQAHLRHIMNGDEVDRGSKIYSYIANKDVRQNHSIMNRALRLNSLAIFIDLRRGRRVIFECGYGKETAEHALSAGISEL